MANKVEEAILKKSSRSTGKKGKKNALTTPCSLTSSTYDFINSVDLSQLLQYTNDKPKKTARKAMEKVISLRKKAQKNLKEMAEKNSLEIKKLMQDEEKAKISSSKSQASKKNTSKKDILSNSLFSENVDMKEFKRNNLDIHEMKKNSVHAKQSLKIDFLKKLSINENRDEMDTDALLKSTKNVQQIISDNAKIVNHPLTKAPFNPIPGDEMLINVTYPTQELNINNRPSLESIEDNLPLDILPDNPFTGGKKSEIVNWMVEERRLDSSLQSSYSSQSKSITSRRESISSQKSQDLEKFLQDLADIRQGESFTSVVTKFKMAKSQIIQIINQLKNKTLVYVEDLEEPGEIEEIEKCKQTLAKIHEMKKSIEKDKRKVEKYAQQLKEKKEQEIKEAEEKAKAFKESRHSKIFKEIKERKESKEDKIQPPKKKRKNDKSVHELFKANNYDSCMDLVDKLLHVKNKLYPVLFEIQKETSNMKGELRKKNKGPLCAVSKLSFQKASEASRIFQNLGRGEQKYDIPPHLTDIIVNNLCYADCFNKADIPEEDRVYIDADTLKQLLSFYETLSTLIGKLQEADAIICNKGCIESCPGPSDCTGGKVCEPFRANIEAIAAGTENVKMRVRQQVLDSDMSSKQKMAFFTRI